MHFHIKEHNSNRKSQFFNFFYPKAEGTKFDLANDLWPRSTIDLDLQNFLGVEYECIFISKSTTATEKVIFSTFSIHKPWRPNVTLP